MKDYLHGAKYEMSVWVCINYRIRTKNKSSLVYGTLYTDGVYIYVSSISLSASFARDVHLLSRV